MVCIEPNIKISLIFGGIKKASMQSNRLYTKHRSRIISFNILIFSFTLFLIINFFLIQVIFSDTYQNEISNKTTALRKIKGNRGSIFDIHGNLLAYSIEKCRFLVNTKQDNNIEEITNFFETKFKDKNKVNYNFKNTKSTYSLIVQDLVSYENQKIIEDSKSIKNLNYSLYKHRLYPYNELAAQVIGFTNNDNHGKYGIEGYFNNILNGTEKLVEFNKKPFPTIVDFSCPIFLLIRFSIRLILSKFPVTNLDDERLDPYF